MAKVGPEFATRSAHSDLTIAMIGEDERRRASTWADMCLEIVDIETRNAIGSSTLDASGYQLLPSWAIAMTKEEHASFAQDLITTLSRALDIYQNRFPKQDVCLDSTDRCDAERGLQIEPSAIALPVFCRRVIYRDEASRVSGVASRSLFQSDLGELDRPPPAKLSDRHLRIAEYHGLACACLLVAGLLEPKRGSAIGLAIT